MTDYSQHNLLRIFALKSNQTDESLEDCQELLSLARCAIGFYPNFLSDAFKPTSFFLEHEPTVAPEPTEEEAPKPIRVGWAYGSMAGGARGWINIRVGNVSAQFSKGRRDYQMPSKVIISRPS